MRGCCSRRPGRNRGWMGDPSQLTSGVDRAWSRYLRTLFRQSVGSDRRAARMDRKRSRELHLYPVCSGTGGGRVPVFRLIDVRLARSQQWSDVEVEAQGGVADDLVEVAHGEIVVADVAHGGPRRGVDVEAGVFAELADAEEVGGVGDDDDVVEIVFAGDGGEAMDLLLGIDGAGFGDDAAEGNSIGEEVVAADASFGVAGVFVAAAAEGDDQRGDVLAVEVDGVIEAGVKHGRWAA